MKLVYESNEMRFDASYEDNFRGLFRSYERKFEISRENTIEVGINLNSEAVFGTKFGKVLL